MNNETNICHTHPSICWKSIIAAAFVAIGLFFLFNVLSLGIGLSSLTTTKNGIEILAVTAFVWVFVGTYVIFFLSAYVAGKLGHVAFCNKCMTGNCYPNTSTVIENKEGGSCCVSHKYGMLYGFVTWSLVTLALVLVAGFAGTQNVLVNSIQNQMLPSKVYMERNLPEYANNMQANNMNVMQAGAMQPVNPRSNFNANNQVANNNPQVISNETKEESHKVGLMDLAAFLLLLSGAIGGVCGGYYSSRYHKCCHKNVEIHN